jgi:hypothetical protein
MTAFARRTLLISVLVSALASAGCAHADAVTGSGRMLTESRTAAGFEAVQLEASVKLVLRQGKQEALQIKADDNLLPLIETLVETRGGAPTLVVRWKRGTNIRSSSDSVVTVDAIRLRGLSVSGSGSIEAGSLTTDRLRMGVSGSGDVRVSDLTADDVEASIAGSGDVWAGGRAARLKVNIAGSGDADLSALTAEEVKVSIAGSGDAKVSAEQALSVSIAGSGDVRYGGKVTAVKTSIVGSGDVRRR